MLPVPLRAASGDALEPASFGRSSLRYAQVKEGGTLGAGQGFMRELRFEGAQQATPTKKAILMKLLHIELSDLKPSPLNVRKHGANDVSDLVLSIRNNGLLQPLLVRPHCEGFEVIAGQRRLRACQILNAEQPYDPLPCIVMEEGDDATAIEASLAENVDRLPMDGVDQFQAFAALIAKGRTIEEIAAQFGVTELLVRQRLAFANLQPAILQLFRRYKIGDDTLRALTLAGKSQQKAWLKRFNDPNDYAPQGRALRNWLLGGEQIATNVALFGVADYPDGIVSDLFGEESYFANSTSFWGMQKDAIAKAVDEYRARGWADVVLLDKGAYWPSYDYRKAPKKQGGKVYVGLSHDGEVTFHEGYLPHKELRGKSDADTSREASGEIIRPELTKAALNYVDLHRHAAVRSSLLDNPDIALRLMLAHAIAGSSLWRVQAESQRAEKPETASSLAASEAQRVFDAERARVLALLGFEEDAGQVVSYGCNLDIETIFEKLLTLDEEGVRRINAFVMAESLASGTALIDRLGQLIGTDLADKWEADDAFLDLVRDREVLLAILADIGGEVVSVGHKDSTAKIIRSVIRQYASGDGRPKVQGWVPPYMSFPARGYTERGGIPAS